MEPYSVRRVLSALVFLLFVAPGLRAGDSPAPEFWNGEEPLIQYAKRLNLPPTKSIDVGHGVLIDTVLIPAGEFVMGTPDPEPVDEAAFAKKIFYGRVLGGIGAGLLAIVLFVTLFQAIRFRRRPQFSLARLTLLSLLAALCVGGLMQSWTAAKAVQKARVAYEAAKNASEDERPARKVTLEHPFYLGVAPVTQEQFELVMNTNPSRFKGPSLPVENVKWESARAFCKKLGETASQPVRLPTDAEWEYACRAGTKTAYFFGDSEADLDRSGWYAANSGGSTHPVKQKEPNRFGLYDMHGGVWQWTQRRFPVTKTENPNEAPDSGVRIWRGGSWDDPARNCRSASLFRYSPDYRGLSTGFRVVISAK